MSIKIMTTVWEQSPQKGSALLTLLALADWANDAGVTWYGISKLQKKTRLSDRNVQRIVAALAKTRDLMVGYEQGPHGTNLYLVCTGMERAQLIASLKEFFKLSSIDSATIADEILSRPNATIRISEAKGGDIMPGVTDTTGGVTDRAIDDAQEMSEMSPNTSYLDPSFDPSLFADPSEYIGSAHDLTPKRHNGIPGYVTNVNVETEANERALDTLGLNERLEEPNPPVPPRPPSRQARNGNARAVTPKEKVARPPQRTDLLFDAIVSGLAQRPADEATRQAHGWRAAQIMNGYKDKKDECAGLLAWEAAYQGQQAADLDIQVLCDLMIKFWANFRRFHSDIDLKKATTFIEWWDKFREAERRRAPVNTSAAHPANCPGGCSGTGYIDDDETNTALVCEGMKTWQPQSTR